MKALFALLLTVLPAIAADRVMVTVAAGEHDRKNTVVTFPWPADRASSVSLVAAGKSFPIQPNEDGTASFVLDHLAKGNELKLEAKPAAEPAKILTASQGKTKLNLGPPQKPWMEYQTQPGDLPRANIKQVFQRGAYLHPIRTLSGKTVTDDYPANHAHHHGVWWAWTKTSFDGRAPDFWNMGSGGAKVDFVALDKTWSGPVHAGFASRHRFVDLSTPTPTAVLNEAWDVRVYNTAGGSIWIFDLTSTQECATDKPLKLPEYHYGGLGFRGHWDWNGKTNTDFLTSEGITDRVKGHGTRARWCDISGIVEGARAGITIMCHPENFRAPQNMRLHPTEPFFCYTPQQGGDMEITPGKKYISRYRFLVHDGPPDNALIERAWTDYAHPPTVKVN